MDIRLAKHWRYLWHKKPAIEFLVGSVVHVADGSSAVNHVPQHSRGSSWPVAGWSGSEILLYNTASSLHSWLISWLVGKGRMQKVQQVLLVGGGSFINGNPDSAVV